LAPVGFVNRSRSLPDNPGAEKEGPSAIPQAHTTLRGGSMKDVREIHRKAYLAAETRAGDVFASENAEAKAQSMMNRVLTAGHRLKLRSSQISVFGVSAKNLGSKRD